LNYYTVQWRLPLLVDRLRIASQAHVTPLHHLNPGHVTRVTSHQAGTGIIRSGRDTITFCVRAATLRLSRRQFFSTDDTRQRTLAGERTELTRLSFVRFQSDTAVGRHLAFQSSDNCITSFDPVFERLYYQLQG